MKKKWDSDLGILVFNLKLLAKINFKFILLFIYIEKHILF